MSDYELRVKQESDEEWKRMIDWLDDSGLHPEEICRRVNLEHPEQGTWRRTGERLERQKADLVGALEDSTSLLCTLTGWEFNEFGMIDEQIEDNQSALAKATGQDQ